MKQIRLVLVGLVLLLLCAGVGFSLRPASTASPNSPAVGTWKKGGVRYILGGDGTGQQLLGRRKTSPLTWSEQNGTVDMTIQDGGLKLFHTGQLSPDGRTLTITQMGGKTGLLGSTSAPANIALKKQ